MRAPPRAAPFGTSHYLADLLLHFEDGQGYLRADDHLGGRCEYRGPYQQTGKIIRFPARRPGGAAAAPEPPPCI